MPISPSQRLRIPSHYYVYSDPPDKKGDEVLHFISSQRRVRLKGHSFREFVQHVVPLLDGSRTVDEIHSRVTDWFAPQDLDDCLTLLSEQLLIEDAGAWHLDDAAQARLRPQLNLLHEISAEPWRVQDRLGASRVTVFGLTGAGVAVARTLASMGLGSLRCVDDAAVGPADLYFSTEFQPQDAGHRRVDALRRHLLAGASSATFEAVPDTLSSDDAMDDAVRGSDFIVNCLDEGQVALVYRLNRACLRARVPWTSVAPSGLEVVVGPTVYPKETACYMCYRMRMVACEDNPEARYDFENFLDRRRSDDSGNRANLAPGPLAAAQLAVVEVLKHIGGFAQPVTGGRVHVFDLRTLTSTIHVVLRKPWCPACFADWDRDVDQ